MSVDVEIDRDVCMGSGNCLYAAPGAFELDADGIASVIDPAAASTDELLAAARQCPTGAISVREVAPTDDRTGDRTQDD